MSGPPAKSTLRRTSTALLSVLSVLGAFVACEVALRLFHPKYEDVAQSQRYQADESRVWAPMPNTSRYNAHPDTGARHPVIYNNFGSRQHRHFDVDALKQAENVAFFGDSYVENSGIEAQYSFTEVLDFLLNLGGERASHDDRAFNVLNFGVDGYGPGQEFVWYQQFPHREDLDDVFYVFCNNDIENFHHHGLFSLDDSGDLVPNVAVVRGFLTTALSRLHSTYLVLDFGQRLNLREKRDIWTPPPRWYAAPAVSKPIAKIRRRILLREQRGSALSGDPFDDSIAVFQTLLLHWKDVVEEHGGEFRVVVLPYMDRRIVQGIFPEQLEVVYLFDCFDDMIPGFDDADWRFRTDAHWNEAGNMMAAHCLYRLLERETKASRLSETALANGLQEYYSAVGTGNWSPPPPQPTCCPRRALWAKSKSQPSTWHWTIAVGPLSHSLAVRPWPAQTGSSTRSRRRQSGHLPMSRRHVEWRTDRAHSSCTSRPTMRSICPRAGHSWIRQPRFPFRGCLGDCRCGRVVQGRLDAQRQLRVEH